MEDKILQNLLRLGFKDQSTIHCTLFILEVNNFSLRYINGKFELEGDGGYEYSGTLDMEHLQVDHIKTLYSLLTGENISDQDVLFDYNEWQENLRIKEEQRIENMKKFFPEGFTKLPDHNVGFLNLLETMGKPDVRTSRTIVWHESENLKPTK